MKFNLQRLLPKNSFARSVSVLAGGTAAGQVIVVMALPLLTRLYTPDDFGVLAVFSSMLAILSVVASLRYQLAIPLPENDKEASSIAGLSILVVVLMSVLAALLVLFFRNDIVELFNTPAIRDYLWLLPLGLFFAGSYQVLNFWAIRVKAFPAIARTKLTQSAGMTIFQVGGFALGPLALLVGSVIGQAAGNISLWKFAVPKATLNARTLNWKMLTQTAKRYKHFPMYSSGAGLLNTAGAQMTPLFFAALFGPAAAGAYMLAQRVINIPMTVLASAVADAFLPNAVEARRNEQLGSEVENLFRTLAIIIFPLATILSVLAPELFVIAFGSEWRESGEIVRWLAPMLAIQFLINPLARIFVVVERQRLGLILQATLFCLRISALIGAFFLSISVLNTVKVYSGMSALGYFLYYIAITKICCINIKKQALDLLSPLIISSVVFCLSYGIKFSFSGCFLELILSITALVTVLSLYWYIEIRRKRLIAKNV